MLKRGHIVSFIFTFLLAGLMACSTTEESQKSDSFRIVIANTSKVVGDSVYVVTQKMPKLIGTRAELQRHLEYPESCREAGVEGTVIIGFTVTKTGELTDFEVIQGIVWGCDEAAIQALKYYAEFTVGTSNGEPIPVHMSFPFLFHLD